MASVSLSPNAGRQFEALPRTVQTRILSLFERLRSWPEISGAKPLRGELAGKFRLRTGDYRLLFSVREGAVLVEQIGHRDGFYEE